MTPRTFFFSSRRSLLASALMLTLGTPALAAKPAPQVQFTTSEGNFVVELYPDKAPKTVANFLHYVKAKHYDGTIFHRVIPDFMIQGGGYDAKLIERPARQRVQHEGRQAYQAGLRNVTGSIAMARTNDPDSAGAQFFINVKDNGFLDPVPIPDADPVPRFVYQGRTYTNMSRASLERAPQLYGYTVFGKVVSGMDTVMRIRQQPTGPLGPFASDVPRHTVLIESATQIK